MLITNTPKVQLTKLSSTEAAGVTFSAAEESQGDSATPEDSFKKNVTTAAHTAGGALAGLTLGAVGGSVLSQLSGTDTFARFGGVVGSVGGAGAALALSLSDEKVSSGRMFAAWTGATVGAPAGMYILQAVGGKLAAGGAAAVFGTHAALAGTLVGGLAGTGLAFTGDDSKVGKITKDAAVTGIGASVGMVAGGTLQAFLANNASHLLAPIGAAAPAIGAATVGLMALNTRGNPGWSWYLMDPNDSYSKKEWLENRKNPGLDRLTKTAIGGTVGYGVGSAVGAVAHAASGNPLYLMATPAVGALVGTTGAVGSTSGDKNSVASKVSLSTGLGATGFLLGDAVGYGLTALTGNGAFAALGSTVGAANGAVLGLGSEVTGKYAAPALTGATMGLTTGTLLGAGLTALTGSGLYQHLGTALGAVAGLTAGLAVAGSDLMKGPSAPE